MGANAAVSKNRAKVYAAMYQAAGEKWVKAGAVFCYGFGLRCLDAVRPAKSLPQRGTPYRHIRGAYCLPEYRGKGLYQNLLDFLPYPR